MPKRERTPQEKKLLSYAKDGRNTRSECRRAAHKAITRRKMKANRALRRAESMVMRTVAEPGADADIHIPRIGRRSWQKIPDAPLGEYLAARLMRREERGMNAAPKASPLLIAGRRRARFRAVFFIGSLQTKFYNPSVVDAGIPAPWLHTPPGFTSG